MKCLYLTAPIERSHKMTNRIHGFGNQVVNCKFGQTLMSGIYAIHMTFMDTKHYRVSTESIRKRTNQQVHTSLNNQFMLAPSSSSIVPNPKVQVGKILWIQNVCDTPRHPHNLLTHLLTYLLTYLLNYLLT